jgi:hypothetical protein
MNLRRALAAAVCLAIVLAAPVIAKDKHPLRHPGHRPHASLRYQVPAAIPVEGLYSRRALRRARTILQLRMLELREARLDCLRAAIARRLPEDLTDRAARLARSAGDCAARTR